MRSRLLAIGLGCCAAVAGTAFAAGPPGGPLKKCPPDSVVAGTTCMDKYEASVWRVPNPTTTNKGLVSRIQSGKATLAHLVAGGASQLGVASDNYAPCSDSGQNCGDDVYAVSVAGVTPSAYVTSFQALAACENSRKRLPSNAEWQSAVAGSPDPGTDDATTDCNSEGAARVATGSRSGCVSASGAFDMVGNVLEWVADWEPLSSGCGSWSLGANDSQCLAGVAGFGEPASLLRGGGFGAGDLSGPLTVAGTGGASVSDALIGFRCSR